MFPIWSILYIFVVWSKKNSERIGHPIPYPTLGFYYSCFKRSGPCTAFPGRLVLLRCICLCNRMLNSRHLVTGGIWMEASLFFERWWSLISSGTVGTFCWCCSKASERNAGQKGLHPAVCGCLSVSLFEADALLWLCAIFCSTSPWAAVCSGERGISRKKLHLL